MGADTLFKVCPPLRLRLALSHVELHELLELVELGCGEGAGGILAELGGAGRWCSEMGFAVRAPIGPYGDVYFSNYAILAPGRVYRAKVIHTIPSLPRPSELRLGTGRIPIFKQCRHRKT